MVGKIMHQHYIRGVTLRQVRPRPVPKALSFCCQLARLKAIYVSFPRCGTVTFYKELLNSFVQGDCLPK